MGVAIGSHRSFPGGFCGTRPTFNKGILGIVILSTSPHERLTDYALVHHHGPSTLSSHQLINSQCSFSRISLPETVCACIMDGWSWNIRFLLEWPIFRGKLLLAGNAIGIFHLKVSLHYGSTTTGATAVAGAGVLLRRGVDSTDHRCMLILGFANGYGILVCIDLMLLHVYYIYGYYI